MAIKSGFYDSLNGDRKYDSLDFGRVFDGVISDGIFANKDGGLRVTHDISGTSLSRGVKVNPGKCWFNHTFVTVDDYELVTISPPDPVNYRIDTIVVEIDRSTAVRNASIKVLQGEDKPTIEAARTAVPVLKREGDFGCNQYALAVVGIRPNANIDPRDILDLRGTNETPYSVGLVDQIKASGLIDQWTADYSALVTRFNNTFSASESGRTNAFDTWFNQMKDQLTTDAAGNLQTQVNEINQKTAHLVNPQSISIILRRITSDSCELQKLKSVSDGDSIWIQIIGSGYVTYAKGVANQNFYADGTTIVINKPISTVLSDILSYREYEPQGILNELDFLRSKKRYSIENAFYSRNTELANTGVGSIYVVGNLVHLYLSFTVRASGDLTNTTTFGQLKAPLKPIDYVGSKVLNSYYADAPDVWIDPSSGDIKIYAKASRKLINNKIYYLSMTYMNAEEIRRY